MLNKEVVQYQQTLHNQLELLWLRRIPLDKVSIFYSKLAEEHQEITLQLDELRQSMHRACNRELVMTHLNEGWTRQLAAHVVCTTSVVRIEKIG